MNAVVNRLPQGRIWLPILLLVAALVIGVLLLRGTRSSGLPSLSSATLEVIAGLREPVELRFYRNADSTAPSPGISGFGKRASNLLAAYANASKGKITVTDLPIKTGEEASRATADGIRPFNIEKGDAAFLGIVAQMGLFKETLPALSPDFEAALEADITRTLQRLQESKRLSTLQQEQAQPVSEGVVDKVKSLVPNYSQVSLEDGTKAIQESMLGEMHKAGAEFDARMAELKSEVERAAGNPAEQEAVRQKVNEAGAAHAAKLKEIVANTTAQLQALRQLKNAQ